MGFGSAEVKVVDFVTVVDSLTLGFEFSVENFVRVVEKLVAGRVLFE